MPTQIQLGDVAVDVLLKNVKNIHLSVYPPSGRVRITAPTRTKLDTLRVYAISRLAWIRQQQRKIREQDRETPRVYLDRESHYLWGKRYLLTVLEQDEPAGVSLKHKRMILSVRPGADQAVKADVLALWYRRHIREAVPSLISKWEATLGVRVKGYFVQHMKTKWGSCNHIARTIRLNTELAKKPKECLEYIVLHEMVHFLEPTHNARFIALMDQFMPRWQYYRQKLNRLPVRHEDWSY